MTDRKVNLTELRERANRSPYESPIQVGPPTLLALIDAVEAATQLSVEECNRIKCVCGMDHLRETLDRFTSPPSQ